MSKQVTGNEVLIRLVDAIVATTPDQWEVNRCSYVPTFCLTSGNTTLIFSNSYYPLSIFFHPQSVSYDIDPLFDGDGHICDEVSKKLLALYEKLRDHFSNELEELRKFGGPKPTVDVSRDEVAESFIESFMNQNPPS